MRDSVSGTPAEGDVDGLEHPAPDPGPLPRAAISTPGPELARVIAGLMLLALILGRAIAPALIGSSAGIANIIDTVQHLAAGISQLMLVAGCLVIVRLLLLTLREQELSAIYRLLVVPLSAGAVMMMVNAHDSRLNLAVTLAPAISAALLAMWASPFALRDPRSRALGIVLGFSGLLALAQVGSRLLGIIASNQALADLFTAARGVATFSLLLDTATIGFVGYWLLAPHPQRGAIVGGILVVLAAGIAWVGSTGAGPDANTAQVLVGRSLDELTPNPSPFVAEPLRHAIEVLALLVAGVCVFARRTEAATAGAMSMVLLARGSTDIPLCAESLLIASLMAPLISARSMHPRDTNPIVSLFFWATQPQRGTTHQPH